LLDDKAAEFDRLAERAAEGVRTAEPDTLVYVIHVVPKAPMQRIIYEIYRDRAAFESHEQQPHIQRFVADRRSCVLATNIIDLRLKYAKVAALATAQAPEAAAAPGFGQETQLDRVPAGLGSGDRYATNGYSAANGQYQSSDRYAAAGQYQANGQYQATEQYAASGTGQYAANDQYTASGAAQYTPPGQHAAGSGQYGSGQLSNGGQYGSGQHSDGQYGDGQYSSGQYGSGQYSSGNYDSGQYATAGNGRQQGSGRYPELGSGRQPDGGGRHAETTGGYDQAGGYGRSVGYGQGGQSGEPDQDTGTDARTPRFEPAEWDRTASRAGRY
jgi:quinol monooxygenase YgiN